MHMFLWKKLPQVAQRVVFAEFDWKYHAFLNIKTEVWDLKILLFIYWNHVFLGSIETYFLEVCAYVSVKRTTASVWEVCFCLISLEISHFFKYKNGGVGPNNFIVNLLKLFFLGSVEHIFWKSMHMCLWKEPTQLPQRAVFCCFLLEILHLFKYKNGGVGFKILLFSCRNDIFLGSIETFFLEVCAYLSVKKATARDWEVRFS